MIASAKIKRKNNNSVAAFCNIFFGLLPDFFKKIYTLVIEKTCSSSSFDIPPLRIDGV